MSDTDTHPTLNTRAYELIINPGRLAIVGTSASTLGHLICVDYKTPPIRISDTSNGQPDISISNVIWSRVPHGDVVYLLLASIAEIYKVLTPHVPSLISSPLLGIADDYYLSLKVTSGMINSPAMAFVNKLLEFSKDGNIHWTMVELASEWVGDRQITITLASTD